MSDFQPEQPPAYAPPPPPPSVPAIPASSAFPTTPPPPAAFATTPPPPAAYSYPAYGAPAVQSASNGAATAGLVLGIVAIFINTLLIPSILGIVFASVGLKNATQFERLGYGALGRGPAAAGLVCSIIAVAFSLLFKWMFLFLI